MKRYLYSVYDSKAESYGPLVEFPNLPTAIRAIKEQFSTSPHVLGNKEDFFLVELGVRIDDDSKLSITVYDSYRQYNFSEILPEVIAPEGGSHVG